MFVSTIKFQLASSRHCKASPISSIPVKAWNGKRSVIFFNLVKLQNNEVNMILLNFLKNNIIIQHKTWTMYTKYETNTLLNKNSKRLINNNSHTLL